MSGATRPCECRKNTRNIFEDIYLQKRQGNDPTALFIYINKGEHSGRDRA